MKHWDLVPGEIVTLSRKIATEQVRLRFLFRDTLHACFERLSPEGLRSFIEFDLRDDGLLIRVLRIKDSLGQIFVRREVWHIDGPDRNTRTIVERPIGESPHFTLTRRGVNRAL